MSKQGVTQRVADFRERQKKRKEDKKEKVRVDSYIGSLVLFAAVCPASVQQSLDSTTLFLRRIGASLR